MRKLAQPTIIAAALAGLAFGGIAVSQGTPPDKNAPEKVDPNSVYTVPFRNDNRIYTTIPAPKDDPPAAATGLPGQYGIQSQYEIRSMDGSALKGYQISDETAAKILKEIGPDGTGETGTIGTPPGICKPLVTAQGMAPLRAGAEFNAKYNWKKAAGGNDWDFAKGKAMNCRQEGPLRRWSCVATGCAGSGQVMPQCQAQLSATGGWAKLQSGAEAKARDQWQHDSGNTHGADYKWWNKARNQDINCSHDGRKPILRQWQCVARADPCS